MIKQVRRGWAIAKSRTTVRSAPVSSILSPHFLRLRDLCDPDFARGKLSYRGRTSRLCKILTFPLHGGFPGGSVVKKNPPANVGDMGLICGTVAGRGTPSRAREWGLV